MDAPQWTAQEDRLLKEAVAQHGEQWAKVAAQIERKTAKECRTRYRAVFRDNTSPWTQEEDAKICAIRSTGRHIEQLMRALPTRDRASIEKRCNELGKGSRKADICLSMTKDNAEFIFGRFMRGRGRDEEYEV